MNDKFQEAAKKGKWIVTIVFAVLLIGFIGDHSFVKLVEHKHEIVVLEKSIEDFNRMYSVDSLKLSQLEKNPHAYGRVAREKYLMKKDDEDIYVFEKLD